MSNKLIANDLASSLTILFMPESAFGPMNNCIGIGNMLQKMGHQCVFVIESSWKGKLAKYGFREKLIDLSENIPSTEPEKSDQFWSEFISNQLLEFRKSPLEQLRTFMHSTWKALIDGVKFSNEQLKIIIEEIKPDVIVEDNVVTFPALITNNKIPFVRIVSCNPLEIRREENIVPPPYSGLSSNNQSQWINFQQEYKTVLIDIWKEFNHWIQQQGASPLPQLEFIHTSKYLNLYIYPEIIDYNNKSLSLLWTRLDSCVRTTENEDFQLPSHFKNSKIIYVSLGSLGFHDVSLMKRLIELFRTSKYCFLFSLGSKYHEYINLPKNICGYEILPQTIVLPLVDMVITHGGNNTVCESLHFGKPMIILPLFWDQHDNAQRLHETGYGIRLDTYTFTDQQMYDSIEYLINNQTLRQSLASVGECIRVRNGLQLAAEKIEQCGRQTRFQTFSKP
jgi:MGT family glycosyltransferase